MRIDGVALREDQPDLAMPDRLQGLIGFRLGARIGSRTRVQARVRWIHDASEGRQTQLVPGLGAFRIDLPQRTDRFAVHVVELIDIGKGSTLRLALGQQWAFDTTEKDRYESPLDELRARNATLSSFEATATFADGPRRTWVVGTRAEVEKLSQQLTKSEFASGQIRTTTADELTPATLGSIAAYAQLGWKPIDTLTVLVGGRGEMHLRYGAVVVPRLALSYQPSRVVTVRASLGRGFRAPAAKEIGFAFDHGALGYRVLGNPDLGPETSWGTSGDVSLRMTKNLLVRGGVFANWIDNMIDIDIRPTTSQLEVPVSSSGRTFVSYKEPAIVTPMGDGSMDSSWDIAFEKYDIFTNSGVSGPGDGGAFGPLEMQGAPIAAIYRLRWAEVTSSGAGPTQELVDIDGTAGGSQPADDVPSECLDLGSGARVFHTPASALATKDWHLCFRRATISVNGEPGGPRGVTAVDLHAGETKNETLAILRERTADTELARFDAVGHSELMAANLVWRGDRVISAFSEYWVESGTNPKAPADFSWLTMAADGVTRYLLVFDRFEGATEESPGKVVLRIRPEGL